MGVLNHLFGSTESIVKEIELDDDSLLDSWKDYHRTVSAKKVIIEKLATVKSKSDLEKLNLLLISELTNIRGEEKEESEIIADLELIEQSQKVKRVHKLEKCLRYAETKYEYVYGLLQQIHSTLQSQMCIVAKLQTGSKETEKLIVHLQSLLELEIEILKKVDDIGTFHELFLALVKGEHIIKTMDAREKRLLKKMQKGISQIFSQEIAEGITYEWAMTVFNAVQDIVMDHEAIIAKGFDPHENVDFEFVNRQEFVDLVRESIQNIRSRKVSEQMISVFVHLFREWYNYERD